MSSARRFNSQATLFQPGHRHRAPPSARPAFPAGAASFSRAERPACSLVSIHAGRGGHRGPALLRPQRRDEIVSIPQTDALFLKSPAQRFHHGRAYAKAVCCQGAALRQRFGQPVFHCGRAGLRHAHQLNAAARKLAPGLDKVAPIRPPGGLVLSSRTKCPPSP